jgi:sigma-B regulation protein RsbU (phosphoserine phosphatase)
MNGYRTTRTYPLITLSPSEPTPKGPRFPTLDYHGRRRVCETGADFFDFLSVADSTLAFCMGAVSAQSSDSGLIASGLESILCSLCADPHATPAHIAAELNRFVRCAPDDTAYAPFFYASIDPVRRELCYVNAGHEPALLLRKRHNRAIRLESTGAVLGLSNRSRYGQRSIPLEPGDLLAIFSEGVAETFDCQGNPFGADGVLKVMKGRPQIRAMQLVEDILDAAEQYAGWAKPIADHTAAVIRFIGGRGACLPAEAGRELEYGELQYAVA